MVVAWLYFLSLIPFSTLCALHWPGQDEDDEALGEDEVDEAELVLVLLLVPVLAYTLTRK